jgi:hypothetical protein
LTPLSFVPGGNVRFIGADCFWTASQVTICGQMSSSNSYLPELYGLRADIGESDNVADANPDVVAKLQDVAARYDADLKANSRPVWRAGGE